MKRYLLLLSIFLALVIPLGWLGLRGLEAGRRAMIGGIAGTGASPDALGKFVNSYSTEPVELTFESYTDSSMHYWCEGGCSGAVAADLERDFRFPLHQKLTLRLPQHYIERLDGHEGRLGLIEIMAWESDFAIGKLALNQVEADNLFKDRHVSGDYRIRISLTGNHRPRAARTQNMQFSLSQYTDGSACAAAEVTEIDMLRIIPNESGYFGVPNKAPCRGSLSFPESKEPEKWKSICASYREKECNRALTDIGRLFIRRKFDDAGSFVVQCGGRGGNYAAETIKKHNLQLDAITLYWRDNDATVFPRNFSGGLCTMRGFWGGWRFEALVRRDGPLTWQSVYEKILKFYDSHVVHADGDTPVSWKGPQSPSRR
jgi:hypothetical protein